MEEAYITIAIDYPDTCQRSMLTHHTNNIRQFGHAHDKTTGISNDTNAIQAKANTFQNYISLYAIRLDKFT